MQKAIDSHFHIWRQKDQPWLVGPMVPRIFGPYEPIRRDYPIEEFLADQKGSGVEKAVYVQTNWAKEDFEKEVAFLQRDGEAHRLAACHRRLCRHDGGRCPPADRPAEEISAAARRAHAASLARDAGLPLRQIRRPGDRPHGAQKNVARLKDYGLSFDLQLFPAQMKDGLQLVGENPETDFILTHAGMLTDCRAGRGGVEGRPAHAGQGARTSTRNSPASAPSSTATIRQLIGYVVDNAIDILGSDRLMFGSNFPIEKLWTSHAELIAAHRAAVAKHGAEAEADIFWNTAERVYRPV